MQHDASIVRANPISEIGDLVLLHNDSKVTKLGRYHRSTKHEAVIVIEILIVISGVIFDVETEPGLRIAPSRQVFK